jgi:hypothetical protein
LGSGFVGQDPELLFHTYLARTNDRTGAQNKEDGQ